MHCKSIDPLLSSYIDGELSGREMRTVREHVSRCSDCAAELETVRGLKMAIASLPDAEPSVDLEERLVAAVFNGKREQTSRLRIAWVGGFAFAGAFLVATMWLQAFKTQSNESAQQVAKSSFQLERDQAYAAGSDPFAGNSVVLTSSHGLR